MDGSAIASIFINIRHTGMPYRHRTAIKDGPCMWINLFPHRHY